MVRSTYWRNKRNTSERTCRCGTWKQHWLNRTGQRWPLSCTVDGCSGLAILGAHIVNDDGVERIVPMCNSCNQSDIEFQLKQNIATSNAVADNNCHA